MGHLVRPTRVDDRPGIEEALRACGAFNDEEVTVALELFDEGLNGGSSYSLLTAEHDGQVCGYVCVGKAPLTDSTWYLYWLCVHPEVQGQGIGRALQRHAEQLIAAHRGRRLVLETSGRPDYHRARQFYEHEGYRLAGRIPDFYKRDDDCLIYVKSVG